MRPGQYDSRLGGNWARHLSSQTLECADMFYCGEWHRCHTCRVGMRVITRSRRAGGIGVREKVTNSSR